MTNSIEKKLHELTHAEEFQDGAMLLGDADSPLAFSRILQAIDNTILPRLVEFSVGASSVTVSAGGRRVRFLAEASEDLKAPDALVGKMLSNDDTNDLNDLKDLLRKLLSQNGTLAMTRRDAGKSAGQSDAGVGVQVLSKQWKIDPNAKPPSQLELFIAALGPDFVASFVVEDASAGSFSAARGNFDVVKVMEAALQQDTGPLHDQLAANYSNETGRKMIVLDGLLQDNNLLCVMTLRDTKALVAASATSMSNFAVAWGGI